MAEFKIEKALTEEISALRESGILINGDYVPISSENVGTLKTSVSIISQHSKIKELLDLYKALVLRDAQDMDDLMEKAEEMDSLISSSLDNGNHNGGHPGSSGGGSR